MRNQTGISNQSIAGKVAGEIYTFGGKKKKKNNYIRRFEPIQHYHGQKVAQNIAMTVYPQKGLVEPICRAERAAEHSTKSTN